MFINKLTFSHVVDFATEELKKYLYMIMPEESDVEISCSHVAKESFNIGLMSGFGLDRSDVGDVELDDIV